MTLILAGRARSSSVGCGLPVPDTDVRCSPRRSMLSRVLDHVLRRLRV